MGGVIFLIAVTVTSLFYVKDYPKIIPVLFLTLGFGIIGFLDDYLKVVLKRSDGLLAWQKYGTADRCDSNFCFLYPDRYTNIESCNAYPIQPWTLSEPWMACSSGAVFAVIGTVNGVNFTDGLDGLASSVTLMVAVFLYRSFHWNKSGIEP